MTNKPTAILFDLQGTIIGDLRYSPLAGNTRLLEIAVNNEGIRAEELQKVAQAIDEELKSLRESSLIEFTVQHFNRLLYDRFNITFPIPPDVVEMEFWKAAVRFNPEPGISETLRTLKSYGIRMGVVSNSSFSGTVLSWELQKHDLLKAFEFVMSSADYGVKKPHSLIFLAAISKLGLDPSEIWFVGDMLQYDILGARQTGLWSVWYNRDSIVDKEISPHAEVGSWQEFTALVEKISGVVIH